MAVIEPGRLRFAHVTIDCIDADALVRFWRPLVGVERAPVREDSIVYMPWDGGAGSLAFQEVPDPTPGKNRAHLDFCVNDLAVTTETVLRLGGSVLQDVETEDGSWRVFTDPEGNEFCVAAVNPS